ncbi:MAG TPA: pitrilysin family protein [Capsulimonadaceae bacterium]|jgi:predicted Zn-dependent peptidase
MIFRPWKRPSSTLIAALLLCSATSLASADSGVTDSTLTNGLHVVVVQNHAVPLVAIDAWVRAGVSRQQPGQRGVAHYLEHLIFKGTTSRPNEAAIDGAIEDLGGQLNGTTSYDWAHFYAVVPAANFGVALNVLSDVLQHSVINAKNVDAERPVILNEVARAQDSSGQLMSLELRRMAYGPNHPYGGAITGTPSDVQAVTRDQIDAFYKTYYVPNNTTIVVSGDVAPDTVKQAVAKELGAWTFSTDLPTQAEIAPIKAPGIQRSVIRRSASESYMTLSFFAPSVKEQPEVWANDVLLTLLGQGGNNRLDSALKDDMKIVTEATSDFLTQRYQGLFTVTCTFPSGNPDQVESAIIAEVKRLRDQKVSDKELDAAKQSLISSYLFEVQTNAGKADALGFYDMIDSFKYDVDYVDHIRSVTVDDIWRVAQRYLTPDAYNVVTVIPYSEPSYAAVPTSNTNQRASTILASVESTANGSGAAH